MPIAGAVFLVAAFLTLIKLFGLVDRSGEVIVIARHTLEVVRSRDLDDDAKEAATQQDAKRLFVLFLVISVGATAAIALPASAIWFFGRVSHALTLQSVIDASHSWQFLCASAVVSCAFLIATRRR